VGEHWDKSLRHLAADAILAAMRDANVDRADILYVGNMLSGELAGQEHLGAMVADFVGLRGIEAFKVEAACGSGAAAVRQGYIAVAAGITDLAICVGIEKMTEATTSATTAGLALAADGDYEAAFGLSFVALNALLMRRYMYEYQVEHAAFAGFTVNAHRNAANNPNAMFQEPVSAEAFQRARMIVDPINLLDSSPIGDGAAAVILAPANQAREFTNRPVRLRASAVATDTLAIHDRQNPLFLQGAYESAQKAYRQANVKSSDIDFFELHDAFTIMAALSLEACGFAPPGHATHLAQSGEICREGRIPIATMGGLKGRGHPVGATGVYQIVEAVQQLRGEAGANQIAHARIGMTQNIGGSGATVITHILSAG